MRKGYYKDLTNLRFGHLTVIKFAGNSKNTGKSLWLVRCDCGKEKVVIGNVLTNGDSKSCGCYHSEFMRQALGKCEGELAGAVWCRLKYNAKTRGHKVSLSQKQASDLFVAQNKKCAITGIDLILNVPINKVTASLDRIDSSKDYELGNVQWIHKDINLLKGALDQNKFIELCRLVTNNNP